MSIHSRKVIQLQGYSFTYEGQGKPAVEDIDICVNTGEVILIAGDSGSGKSTLIKSLNGLIPEIADGKIAGTRQINGKDMANLPIYEVSRTIGSVFQNPRSQFFTLNSTSELVFAMENYGFSREQMRQTISEMEDLLPIRTLMDRDLAELSSGEKQILAIACALSLSPSLLLFDEPSANLDYSNAMRLKGIICKLKKAGKTVLVADHRFFYLAGIIDRVFLVRDRNVTVFENEKSFRESDYNTRSFDLFSMEIPFRKSRSGNEVARVCGVSKWSVKNASFTLYERQITALTGINGAGKTTLAKLLTGTVRPDSGTVKTSGLPFCVLQDADYQLFGTSVEDELDIGRPRRSKTGKFREEKEKILRELGLWEKRGIHPFSLSGGEKQRLQIAVAALSPAKLIIFDEPTSGLDVRSMQQVVKEIHNLAEDKSVLVISHDYEFIRRTADRILYLENGSIAGDFMLDGSTVGTLDRIFKNMEVLYE